MIHKENDNLKNKLNKNGKVIQPPRGPFSRDFTLPVDYDKLSPREKKFVREMYIEEQEGLCYYCNEPLHEGPREDILNKPINWELFPPNFLKYPIHLQHNHHTGMTEGAVHAYCNAVMWQYEGK